MPAWPSTTSAPRRRPLDALVERRQERRQLAAPPDPPARPPEQRPRLLGELRARQPRSLADGLDLVAPLEQPRGQAIDLDLAWA
jgi:hypothetical protein